MKKLLILLLIAIGLSGCGRDYEDILEEYHDEYCKLEFAYDGNVGLDILDKMEELIVELHNELDSLTGKEEMQTLGKTGSFMFNFQAEFADKDFSRCD